MVTLKYDKEADRWMAHSDVDVREAYCFWLDYGDWISVVRKGLRSIDVEADNEWGI